MNWRRWALLLGVLAGGVWAESGNRQHMESPPPTSEAAPNDDRFIVSRMAVDGPNLASVTSIDCSTGCTWALLAKLVRQHDVIVAQNKRALGMMGELVRKSWTIR